MGIFLIGGREEKTTIFKVGSGVDFQACDWLRRIPTCSTKKKSGRMALLVCIVARQRDAAAGTGHVVVDCRYHATQAKVRQSRTKTT